VHFPKSMGFAKTDITGTTPVRHVPDVEVNTQGLKVEGDQKHENSELSSLSRQLSAAAQRAALRDSQLSRSELSALAARILDRLSGASYSFSKSSHDAFLPNTDDAELLDRARRATDFTNGRGPNPFAGLSADQLSLITYDEGGDFTVNERRAARFELADRRSEWQFYITHKMDGERQQTGRAEHGIYEIMDYYRALPPIEEAQIKSNWEIDYMMLLSQSEVEWPEFNTSLIDMVAKEWRAEETSSVPFERREGVAIMEGGKE